MPGWRWKPSWGEVTVFAGVDVQDHRLTPDDTASRLRGTYVGARFGFDVWAEPLDGVMAQASASYSTIGTGYWIRGAVGWRVLDQFYVGPELTALGDTTYRQWRVGAHVTGWHYGPLEWSIGAGYVQDSDARSGAYARLGVLARR